MKRLLIPLAVLLICAFIVSGCTSAPPTPTPSATTPAASAPAPISAATVPARPAAGPANTAAASTAASPVSEPTQAAASSSKKYGGTLRWIEPTAPSSPIGAVWESPFGNSSQQLCFDPLLKELSDGTLLPWLAEYEVNPDPDKPSYTLKIRKGVKSTMERYWMPRR